MATGRPGTAWHHGLYKRRYSFTAPRARVLVRRTKLHDVLRRPVGAYKSFCEACSSKGRSHSLGQIRRVGPGGPENVKGDIAASRVAANELAQRPGAGKKDASFCAGARVQQGEAAARTKCLETCSKVEPLRTFSPESRILATAPIRGHHQIQGIRFIDFVGRWFSPLCVRDCQRHRVCGNLRAIFIRFLARSLMQIGRRRAEAE